MKKLIIIISFIVFGLLLAPLSSLSDNNQGSINILTVPEKVLFDISNMKPGDSVVREIVVSNDGGKDISISSKVSQTAGSEMLFKQFDMFVYDKNDSLLYEGKLSKFKGFEQINLDGNEEKYYKLIAEFPYESGNEFQGLETQFVIELYAEGEAVEDTTNEELVDSDTDVKGGGFLPHTGKELPILFYIIGGVFLVSGTVLYLWTRKIASDHK